MAKRNRSRSETKHTAIMSAAAELFLECGFEATSMDKVAQRAGVSKQTVYSHFNNKDALFVAVLEDKCEQYGVSADLFSPQQNCAQNLLSFGRALNELMSTPEVVQMDLLCSSKAAERPEVALLFYRTGPLKVKQLLEDYLRSQAEAGELDINDFAMASSLFVHLCQSDAVSMARWGVSQQNCQDTQAYLKHAVEMFVQYYTRGT